MQSEAAVRGHPRRHPLTPQTVLALQRYRGQACVTLLLNTRPGPRLEPADVARLDALRDQARARLVMQSSTKTHAVLPMLDALSPALDGPVDHAVALFITAGRTARVDLPVAVADRSVLDPRFATRDLVRALHRAPRHVVLLLGDDEARLLDGTGDRLVRARAGFPLTDHQHPAGESARLRFLQAVDHALGTYLRLHPASLIIAGPNATVASFRWMSRNTTRLAGTIPGDQSRTPPEQLAARVRAVLEQYRQAEALRLLADRRAQDRAVAGIHAAWAAARRQRPEMLAVEQGFFYPARLGDDPDVLHATDDPHAPDVIADIVERLIELVIARGGWIATLDDHALPDNTHIALTLRPR